MNVASVDVVEAVAARIANRMCYEVGGDYYDVLSLGPQSRLLVVADVEGKGVSSAMVMSNLQATLRVLVRDNCLIVLSACSAAVSRGLVAVTSTTPSHDRKRREGTGGHPGKCDLRYAPVAPL